MRKLIIIIIILVIILAGMILYKNLGTKTTDIGIQEIENIENYISQIYMGKEITKQALPCFENINQADERWIWEVVKKNIEEDEISYEQIQEKAKELFGQAFTKEFPKEGTEYLIYNEETNQYEPLGIESDQYGDLFLFHEIKKIDEGYEVEIVEYLEDYSPMLKEDAENFIIIRNLNEEEIGRVSGSTEEDETELVKRNIDKFTKKKIQLKAENERLYVEKVYE